MVDVRPTEPFSSDVEYRGLLHQTPTLVINLIGDLRSGERSHC